MIPISAMKRLSRHQLACDRGFDLHRAVEERIVQYEQGTQQNKLNLLRQIDQALRSLRELFLELKECVESDQADKEISCLEHTVAHLKESKVRGREELAKAMRLFNEIIAQNQALRQKIAARKESLRNTPDDRLVSFIQEAGNRGSRTFANMEPVRARGRQ